MRIGGGELRGRRLYAPKGMETRPTSGRLKKSLFDVLAGRLSGVRVLDLYAGAGALGLEALSRGASSAVFVERGRKAAEAIRRNVEELGLGSRSEILSKDVGTTLRRLEERGEPFDVVFADPPYRSEEVEAVLELLGESALLADGAVVAIEHHHKTALPSQCGTLRRRRSLKAGESSVTLYDAVGDDP